MTISIIYNIQIYILLAIVNSRITHDKGQQNIQSFRKQENISLLSISVERLLVDVGCTFCRKYFKNVSQIKIEKWCGNMNTFCCVSKKTEMGVNNTFRQNEQAPASCEDTAHNICEDMIMR